MEARVEELLSTLDAEPAGEGPLLAAAGLADQTASVTALPRNCHERFASALVRCLRALPASNADAPRRAAATLALARLRDKKAPTPPAFLDAARCLHDALPEVRAAPARNAIIRVCEAFWADGRAGRAALVPRAAVALLERSLAVEAGGASSAEDVRRIYALRDALCPLPDTAPRPASSPDLSDVVDVDAHPLLRALLLRAATSALFHRVPEGQRFVARLLAAPALSTDVFAALLGMLPVVRKSRALACGTIHVYSWKAAGSDFFAPIVQDILKKAIHASAEPLACNLRTVLSSFHTNKKLVGMDKMLHVVYTPVLFRALTAANPLVRRNAAIVLADSFPIHDPGSSNVDLESLLEDQCRKLYMLLEDPVPLVRVAAVEGACRVLGLLWELVPPATGRKMIHIMTATLAFDKTSAQVRAAVCDGLRFMLDNHQTHAVLSVALRRLRKVLNDNVERVRISFLSLLVELKNKRIVSARYFDVVDLDHLVLRLAIDSPACVSKIMQLLVSSFFPLERKNKTRSEIASSQVRACSELLRKSAIATNVFYRNISMYIPPGALVEFCLRVATLATAADEVSDDENTDPSKSPEVISSPQYLEVSQKEPRRRKPRQRANRQTRTLERAPVPSEKALCDGVEPKRPAESDKSLLLGVVATVLESIVPSLVKPSNADLLACLVEIFGGNALKSLLSERGNSLKTRLACLRIAGCIPGKEILPVQRLWRFELRSFLDSLDRSPISQSQIDWVAGLLYCGLSWKESAIILETLESWGDIGHAGGRATSVGSKSSKRPRRVSKSGSSGGSRASKVAAVRALTAVARALVENADLASLYSSSLQAEKDSQVGTEGSGIGLQPLARIPTAVRSGALSAIDAALEDADASSQDSSTSVSLVSCLASSMRLSLLLFTSGAGNAAGAKESNSEEDLCEIVQWGSNEEVMSSLFSRGDDFGWSTVNTIAVHFVDGIAIGQVSWRMGSFCMERFLKCVHNHVIANETVRARNCGELLRCSMASLAACYHLLSCLLAEESQFRCSDSRSTPAFATDEVYKLFKHAVLLMMLSSTKAIALEDSARQGMAYRLAELLLTFRQYEEAVGEEGTSETITHILSIFLCQSVQETNVASDSTAPSASRFLDKLVVEAFVAFAKRPPQSSSAQGCFGFVGNLCDRLEELSITACAVVMKNLTECILETYHESTVLPGATGQLCSFVEGRIMHLSGSTEEDLGVLRESLTELRSSLAELRKRHETTQRTGETNQDVKNDTNTLSNMGLAKASA